MTPAPCRRLLAIEEFIVIRVLTPIILRVLAPIILRVGLPFQFSQYLLDYWEDLDLDQPTLSRPDQIW